MQKQTDRSATNTLKNKYQYNSRQNYADVSNKNSVELGYLKQYEALKSHMRTLESQNRGLLDQIQKLKIEREHSEAKFLKEMSFKENTFLQYQDQKNYQIDQMHMKFEEQVHRLRREKDKQYENLVRQYKRNDLELRQKKDNIAYVETKNTQLTQEIAELEKDHLQLRESYADLSDRYDQSLAVQKNLSETINQLESLKNEMEQEIRILLQIESEKSEAIELLQLKLTKSEASQRTLLDKINHLNANFAQLENVLKEYSEKLSFKERQQIELKNLADKLNGQIAIKQREIHGLNETNLTIRRQFEEALRIQKIREHEIQELIQENERLYGQLNKIRHHLHDLAVKHNFMI